MRVNLNSAAKKGRMLLKCNQMCHLWMFHLSLFIFSWYGSASID